ncbi:MAG: hypothetical protein M1460_04990 [Candidatus Thermoplasmatota archaeon]|jgi:hypothetical protein|nr:hypothetical protein [Candidatus Thermoplasmatota archaeon]MCL5987424.1 hypothetical protein [Candidatus Thermoplasmatota archaeon]
MPEDFSNSEKDQIAEIVKTEFRIQSIESEGPLIIFHIIPESYSQEKFSLLFSKLEKLNLSLYNNGKYEILVTRKRVGKRFSYIKSIFLLLTLLSIIYVGIDYSMTYYPNMIFPMVVLNSIAFFAIPITVIIVSREIPKFFIRKQSGQRYTLPIFIPNPIFMGSMGLINAPGEPYKNHKDQIYSGFFSIVFGIIVSTLFLVLGIAGVSLYSGTTTGPNSSISVVNLPLLFQISLGKLLPARGALDPMALAGWSGLLFTSFNAFPIGLLDGGYVFSGISPSLQKNVSYVFITIMIIIDLTFPSWFILPVIILMVGLEPQQPYSSGFSLIRRGNYIVMIITLLLMVLGSIPFPVHSTLPSIETNPVVSSAIVMSGNHSQANFTISVINNGQITVDPAFSSNLSIPFSVRSSSGIISPGKNAVYYISMNVTSLSPGYTRFLFYVYINSNFNTEHFTVLKLLKSTDVIMDGAQISTVNIGKNKSFNYTVISTAPVNLSENVYVSMPNGMGYNISYTGNGNVSDKLHLIGSQRFPLEIIGSNSTPSLMNFRIDFYTPLLYPVTIAIYNLTYNGSILIIRE